MNPELLLKLFDRISDAPEAIPRLRSFIRDLAVRGKLVEQNCKAELSQELRGKCPDAKNDLPEKWFRCEVGKLLNFQYGKGLPDNARQEKGPVPVFGSNGIVAYTVASLTKKPTIIIGRKGSAGALNLCSGPSWTTDVAYFVESPPFFDMRFLFIELQTLHLDQLGKGVKPGLSRRDAYDLELVVPPLAEQCRIVAKVDELMALCDQLEGARAERESRRDRLTTASHHLLKSGADKGTLRKPAHFYVNHLPSLTSQPAHIQQLRQTVLDLAVRGQLVRQEPNDEPASELLKRIQSEKKRQAKEKKGRREIELPPVDPGRAPFSLPAGWAWARFPELGIFGRGKSKHRPRNDPSLFEGGNHLLVQTGDVARSKGLIKTFTNKYNDVGLAQSVKWPTGTLCITIAANIADSGILTFDACFPDSVVGFVPSAVFPNARYFEYFIRTAKANLLEFAPATAQKNINLEILNAVLVPLPPLAELRRIVMKVDKLIALCDHLEAQLATAQAETSHLLDAILHQALAAAA